MVNSRPKSDAARLKHLCLLHGWGVNASIFNSLLESMGQRREMQAIDLPGYGSSPWVAGRSFESQAADMVDQAKEGVLLGWSLGGLYALEMIRQNPARYEHLILVCSNPCFVRRPDWHCAVESSVFESFAGELASGWKAMIRRFLSLQMAGADNSRQLIRLLILQMKAYGEPDQSALYFGLELLKTLDFRQRLAEIDIPVTLILGSRDLLVPFALKQEISEINPHIRVESIAGAAHAPFLSHTEEFASLIST